MDFNSVLVYQIINNGCAGGLVCRGILETTPQHNVHTFLSLSSPQAGQFGGEF